MRPVLLAFHKAPSDPGVPSLTSYMGPRTTLLSALGPMVLPLTSPFGLYRIQARGANRDFGLGAAVQDALKGAGTRTPRYIVGIRLGWRARAVGTLAGVNPLPTYSRSFAACVLGPRSGVREKRFDHPSSPFDDSACGTETVGWTVRAWLTLCVWAYMRICASLSLGFFPP